MAIARSSLTSRSSSGVRWTTSRSVRITPATWRVLKKSIARSAASASANSRSRSSTVAGGPSRRGALNGRCSSPRASANSYNMSTTACARLREGYAGLVGMVTTRWQRSSASLGSPLSSSPKSSATGPASPRVRISAAASRGRCRLRFAVRPRAVNPTTCTQSSNASSRRSNRATRASTSCVWCAMPSTRYGSYSRGLTRRRSRNPKFLSARTTCAMLTRSWGSWSTTTTLMRPRNQMRSAECGVRNVKVGVALSSDELQDPEPIPVLPVPPQPDPSVAAAPHELPRAPHAARQHLVDDHVEADAAADVRAAPVGRRDRRRDAIPHISAAPSAAYHLRPSSRARATHPQPTAVPPLGHDQPSGHRTLFGGAHVELDAVRVNVVGLVVEPERRCLAGAEAEVGLGHVDREVQRIVVPVDADRDRELFGPGVRFFAAAILVLQLEPQRLGDVEAIERAVERGRPIHAKGRTRDRRGALQLEQRLQRGHRGARAGEPHPLRADLHLPSLGPDRVSLDSPSGLHLHDLPTGAHAADGGGRGHGLEQRDESGPATARAEYVERRFLLGSGLAEPGRPQQLSREQEVRSQLSAVSVQLEDDGSLA